jgi:hypothetical protein
MFHGRGLIQPGVSGLGVFDPTPTGIVIRPTPTCVSPQERDEANQKCVSSTLRGMGQMTIRAVEPMTGRLAQFSACDVRNLPLCPAPKCIDEGTATIIMRCMSGATVDGLNCRDPSTAFYLMALGKLPYCSRPSFLPPVPTCLSPEQNAKNLYCGQYPQSNGPDKVGNAYCWSVKHDIPYWTSILARPVCRPPAIREAPPRPPAPPPPVVVRPPVIQELPPVVLRPPVAPPPPPPVRPPVVTQPPPVRTAPPPMRPPVLTPPEPPMYEPPEEEAPPEPEHRESSMMGLWGILALVAVGGGGYYLYRRYKR